ncbi:MAG: TonB-dependent hemoglobin/transferrin/lactoferrin family receptor [Methylotenera sp.]|nr:TonB-dependent hemoglobin/transferrin/lactoferrin family receptor [Methylotenera sp.]
MKLYKKRVLAVAVLAAMSSMAAVAEEQKIARAEDVSHLKEVVVTATRSEAAIEDIPATITAIDRDTLDRRLPRDEADLFRDEPDVVVARDARRFGATRVNIRGLEDVRVVQMVDGVRLPDFYNGGGPTNFTQSGPLPVMPDFLKRAEILRGPASSLYGSDAIGGVVGYLTLDPGDLLKRDEKTAFGYRISHFGANDGLANTALAAFRGDHAEVLIGLSHIKANETDNRGNVHTISASRTAPNPQDIEDKGLLAKLILRPADGHKLTAMLEGREQDAKTDVRRLSASLPKVTAMQGDDDSRRVRGSLEWEHKAQAGFYDKLTARLYRQTSDTENSNIQTRTNTGATCSAVSGSGNNCVVNQGFFFEQNTTGGGIQLEKAMDFGAYSHALTYGADLSRVETEEKRDAFVYRNGAPKVPSNTLAGDTFPLRDFANGKTDTAGLFVQDEVGGLLGGKLTLTPGLRYDWRRLKPEVDALAQSVLTANGKQAVEQTDSAVSPKLAAMWRFTPAISGWGQVVRGFRAPNYEEVNGSFRNTAQSYGISPNQDLKPETSIGVELGLRATTAKLRGQVAVFDNRYKDFIESVRLTCPADPSCISGLGTTFQSRNLSQVNIRGAEARAAWDFTPGWRLDGAVAYAHGTDESTDQPLNSIEPTRLTLGLAHDAGTWGAEARLRAAASKSRVDDSSGTVYRPAGYTTTDLSAWWQLHRTARITASVNNLFDKKYWLWSDIRQADSLNPTGVDFYSQPGRSLSVSLNLDW